MVIEYKAKYHKHITYIDMEIDSWMEISNHENIYLTFYDKHFKTRGGRYEVETKDFEKYLNENGTVLREFDLIDEIKFHLVKKRDFRI